MYMLLALVFYSILDLYFIDVIRCAVQRIQWSIQLCTTSETRLANATLPRSLLNCLAKFYKVGRMTMRPRRKRSPWSLPTCLTALLSHEPGSRIGLHNEAQMWSECLALQEEQIKHLEEVLQEWSPIKSLLSAVSAAMEHFHRWGLILRKGADMLIAQFASAKPNIIAGDANAIICASPQNGKDLHGREFQKKFSVKVPKVKEDGTLERNNKGNFIFQTEWGVLSCYHIAHHEYWKTTVRTSPLCQQCQRAPRRVWRRATSKERALEALLHSSVTSTTR